MEPDDTVPQARRLALDPDEAPIEVDDEVVALIGSEREQYAIAATYQLRDDDRLGPRAHVYRVRAHLGAASEHEHMFSRLPDASNPSAER